jgi:ABC-type bacteriocin/lantibiotic exporter with double-glycine peptidase domain
MKVKAMNEWSCALACVTSLLNHIGDPVRQEEIVERFSSHFPEWNSRKGLLTQTGMVALLELFDIRIGYLLLTEDKEEFLKAFERMSNRNRYLASFLLTTLPTAHCRRFTGFNAALVELMDPADGEIKRLPWDEIKEQRPKFLLICNDSEANQVGGS